MPPGSSTRIKIEFAQGSDPGRDPNKQINEDSCGYAETAFGHLIVLCDGMGGHYGGKEASRTAIATIFEVIEKTPTNVPPSAALKSAIEEAGRRVYRLGGPPENRARPGSTVVAILLHDRGADVAHVGDSRAYVVRSNQIYPLTRDHSMVQSMIDAGMLSEEQAIGHPDSNKITRALGMRPEVEVDVRPEAMELFPGDILLTSSDGLTDLALGPDILGATRQALASGGVENACTQLIAMANNRGGHDNITVQVARVTEVAPKALTTIEQAPAAVSPPQQFAAQAPPSSQRPYGVPTTAPGVTHAEAAQAPLSQRSHEVAAAAPMQWAPVPPTAADVAAQNQNLAAQQQAAQQQVAQQQAALAAQQQAAAQQQQAAQHQAAVAAQQQAPRAISPTVTGAEGAPGPTWAAHPPPQPAGQTPVPYGGGGGMAAMPAPPQSAGYGAPTSMTGGFGPPSGPMQSTSQPRASKGGIVFLIIGLSAAAAILVVLLIWAFFLR